jgi:hypothetical protein
MTPGMLPPLGGLLEGASSTSDLTTSYSINKRNTNVKLISADKSIMVILNGVDSLTLNINTTAPEYQTDAGFEINDHLALDAPSIDISTTLSDEWAKTGGVAVEGRDTLLSKLRALRDKREIFDVECDFGRFSGMIFGDFNIEEDNKAINSFKVNFGVRRVIRASLMVTQINFIYDEENDHLLGMDVQTGQTVEISLYAFSPLSEKDKSMLDKLWAVTPWG